MINLDIPKSILIVEDIAMNREMIGIMVQKLGYSFETVENGKKALDILKTKKFDMILIDLQMPVLNGYDTARAIREDLGIGHDVMPIIAMTADALPNEVTKCFESGMDDFLTKPVAFIELAGKAEEWLEGGTDSWDIVERDGSTYENMPLLSEADLKTFIKFIGANRLQEVFDDFINDNVKHLIIIRAKDNTDDLIRITLHNMAGTSGNLGMKKLSLYAQYLLNQGIENNRFAENAKLDLLDHIFRDSCQAFKKYLEV